MQASSAQLRMELDELMNQYDTLRRSLPAVQQKVRAVGGSGQSSDRMVKVTTGPRGELTGLELDPKTYRKLTPQQLAKAILDAAQQARRDGQQQVQELLAPLLPAGLPLEPALAGDLPPHNWARGTISESSLQQWWKRVAQDMPGPDTRTEDEQL